MSSVSKPSSGTLVSLAGLLGSQSLPSGSTPPTSLVGPSMIGTSMIGTSMIGPSMIGTLLIHATCLFTYRTLIDVDCYENLQTFLL